ncbi:MAG: ATP-dependent Clp protease ATP-binding subunit ClpX, partial [Eubacterium sp.]|nr:ATP-dependent Clp protease ATP-binding subunit ClpX [Eubacterium sp.]
LAVGVYNHYKRVMAELREEEESEGGEPQKGVKLDGIEIYKSNMLMLGPTGSGKTYMVKTMAKLLQVPLAIADATALTEAGYIGDDVESVVSKLLDKAGNDVELAERGIIYIDEIDKLAKKTNTHSRDISGDAVQQALLKLLEGSDIEVPVGATNKNAMVPMTTVNTSHILFICGGAFPGLEDIIKKRLLSSGTMGFGSVLKDKYDEDDDIFSKVKTEDIREFGLIPEFIGRLPIVFSLSNLDEDKLMRVLTEPRNAIVKQYQKLLEMDEVKLNFEEDALREVAKQAVERKTGARALRSIIEEFMVDIMYEIPKDDSIGEVTITRDYILGKGAPQIRMRGVY